ncbi:hypothetical protein ACB094_07G043000 [Castanea mollissima]
MKQVMQTTPRFRKKIISLTKHISEEAITNLYCSTLPRSLAIADLGCSSGPNTLFLVSELIKVVDKLRQKLGHESPEYQVFLNDLPGNDFNTIFKSLPNFQKQMSYQMGPRIGPCLFSGTPGSFYGRLFPSMSLHFVHSSCSLHWLSQVPEGLDNNKWNIYMACTSPPNVLRAYYEQYQRDFSMFLKCHAKESVAEGGMVLNFLGRRSEDPSSRECCYQWELLAMALNDMVSEGLIDEDKMDSFNIPSYTQSLSEVKNEASAIKWNDFDNEFNASNAFSDNGYKVAKYMRAMVESMLVSHFGGTIIDEVFLRYKKIIDDRISKENCQFIIVTISITKIG